MDIVGITFDGEVKGYIAIKAIKISTWIDPADLSLDVIFRLTIEHKFKKNQFKKIERFYVYFRDEDSADVIIDRSALEQEKGRLEKSLSERSRERKLEEEISPLEKYIYPILTKNIIIEDNGEKKRIRIDFHDYNLTEDTVKRNILFTLKFGEGIFSHVSAGPEKKSMTWYYSCLIEPFLVQTLKWTKEEFMPMIESLELWLQVPEELYRTLSEIDIQPVSHFEQMFLLGKEIAERYQKAGQPLANEKTVCINWLFTDISISSPAEKISVTRGLREFKAEERFAGRFEENPENFTLVLRELLYKSRSEILDFEFIISNVSDKKIKRILEIFNTMVFHRYQRVMSENLNILVPELEYFRNLKHGEEFFSRYRIFRALIMCNRSEHFFSEEILSKMKYFDEYEDILDPEYKTLMKDLSALVELTEEFTLCDTDKDRLRYKDEILSMIYMIYWKWMGKLTHPDGYILSDILTNWKHVIEKEYEEQVPKPDIKATIKAKRLGIADTVGIVFSIENTGKGEASEVQARLLPHDDYDIIIRESETKAYLTSEGRPFEPVLIMKPKNDKKAVILYEICYKDVLDNDHKDQFEDTVEFFEEKMIFRKADNPYIIGDIVRDSKMFFGREELLTSIINNFRGKYQINPVFLYGQRRTGKTSILFHLERIVRDEFIPVFFDVSEPSSRRSFYQGFMERIRKELGATDVEIPIIGDDPFDEFMNEFYSKVRKKLKGKKIVIMIDEYQIIDEFITDGYYNDNVIDFLNALVQDGEIKVILAGFEYPEELKSRKWIRLMKFFITMVVSSLSRDDTVKLITEPVKDVLMYDEGGIEKIISLSGCLPYFVQLICHTMVEYHNYDQTNLIGYEDVTKHLFDYLEKGQNIFHDIIFAKAGDVEKKILFHICDTMEKKKTLSVHRSDIEWDFLKHDKTIGRVEIERALHNLERREIIRKTAEHPDHYEFAIDLYRHWVKWNLS